MPKFLYWTNVDSSWVDNMSFDKLPWKKDEKLFNEAIELLGRRQYEDWVIFRFGMEIANVDNIDIIFRSKFPDAILVNVKTDESLNIEFEECSSNFKEHKHDPRKCDLIVCAYHDWEEKFPNDKCPLPVYVVGEERQKFFPTSPPNYPITDE